tara:strand:- start:1936 stop:2598 length:663 start_codon:yes stop_codon:yes gene_type:complete
MARKKGTPQKAPEYKSKASGKAKDGSACYTRQGNKGEYVTCTGTQKQTGKAVRSGPPPKGVKMGTAKRTGGAPGQAKQTGKAVRSGPPPKGTKKGMAKRTGGAPGQAKQTGKAVRSGPAPKGVKQTGTAKRTGGAPGKTTRLNARKEVLERGLAVRRKNIDDKFDRELAGLHDISDKLEADKRKKNTTRAEFDRAVADLRAFALTNPILKHHDDLSGTKI